MLRDYIIVMCKSKAATDAVKIFLRGDGAGRIIDRLEIDEIDTGRRRKMYLK